MNRKLRIITLEKIDKNNKKEIDTIRVGFQWIRHYNNIKNPKKAVSKKEANLYKSFFGFLFLTLSFAILLIPFSFILSIDELWSQIIFWIAICLYLILVFLFSFWYEFNSGKIILYEKLTNDWKPYSEDDLNKIKDVYDFYNWNIKKELKFEDIKTKDNL